MNATQQFLSDLPRTVSDLIDLNRQYFYTWQDGRVDAINTPDRFARCHDAAAEGCDGSTHGEHIEDFREYAGEVYSGLEREAEEMGDTDEENARIVAEVEKARDALAADIDRCEQWHVDNGSIDQQIG